MRLTPILLYTLMPVLSIIGGLLLSFSGAAAATDQGWMIGLGAMLLMTSAALTAFTFTGWLQRGK